MTEKEQFSKKYLVINEVLNAITHGIGVILSIIGLVFLLLKDGTTFSELISYSVYGGSLILLYLCSTLYHSLIFTKARRILRIFDHSSIFVLIAGTYTPYCVVTIGGSKGLFLLITVWSIALFGIIYKLFWIGKSPILSTFLYIGMGWLIVFALKPLYIGLGTQGMSLLIAGGLSFTVGTIFYSLRKVKFMHVLWHLFVLAGTAFMYFSIFLFV